MTLLTKRLVRELPRPIERMNIVVELDAVGVRLRQKGRRKDVYAIGWDAIFTRAAWMEAERLRRERAKRRRA